jgi:hypothetical protein
MGQVDTTYTAPPLKFALGPLLKLTLGPGGAPARFCADALRGKLMDRKAPRGSSSALGKAAFFAALVAPRREKEGCLRTPPPPPPLCSGASCILTESKGLKPVSHFIGSRVETTRRFQAMGKLDSTCTALPAPPPPPAPAPALAPPPLAPPPFAPSPLLFMLLLLLSSSLLLSPPLSVCL